MSEAEKKFCKRDDWGPFPSPSNATRLLDCRQGKQLSDEALYWSNQQRLYRCDANNPYCATAQGWGIDAVRHCYWLAALTVERGAGFARGLAVAHETIDSPPGDRYMDIWNNECGIHVVAPAAESDRSLAEGLCVAAFYAGDLVPGPWDERISG